MTVMTIDQDGDMASENFTNASSVAHVSNKACSDV